MGSRSDNENRNTVHIEQQYATCPGIFCVTVNCRHPEDKDLFLSVGMCSKKEELTLELSRNLVCTEGCQGRKIRTKKTVIIFTIIF